MLTAYAQSQQISLYSDTTLRKAETNPELLRSNRMPPIRISKFDFSKEFYGFPADIPPQKLYEHLYKIPQCETFENRPIDYYSPKGLSQIVHNLFSVSDYDQSETFSDFYLSLTHSLHNGPKSYARIECRISESFMGTSLPDHVEKFKDIIRLLDRNCKNAFQSAYLSFNYPELSIIHNKMYPIFDQSLCDQYILGGEWCVYLSKSISGNLNSIDYIQLSEIADVEHLISGIMYSDKCCITDFNTHNRKRIYTILRQQLIPAYGLYSWEGLHRLSWSSTCLPETILVFRDLFDPCNPDIAFSFCYDFKEIIAKSGLQQDLLLHGFYCTT